MKKHNIPVLFGVTVVGVLAYWVDFFLLEKAVKAGEDQVYLAFETSFPLADLWLTICLVAALAGFCQQRQRQWVFFGLLGSSAMIFLALTDILFNINQGLYANLFHTLSMTIETGINLWLLLIGLAAIRSFWKIPLT